MLLRIPHPAGQHGGAEYQQNIANNATGDRCFNYIVEPGTQCSQSNYELGGIAECRIEQSANPFAHALRKMLGGPAHPSSERHNSKGGGNENEEIPFRSEQLLPNRHRNQQQEPVHHHGSAPTFEGLRSFRSICSTCHGSRQRRTIKSLVASSVDRMPHTAHMVTRVYINASP